jgi:signal transduction histidine kinase
VGWSILAAVQLSGFYIADFVGIRFPSDFALESLSVLRISGYLGFLAALVILVMVIDNVRQAAANERDQANRLLERERLVADLHDGIGSQLGVLIALADKGRLAHEDLAGDLTACLDDLRLIVDSLDHESRPIDLALAELRARMQRRCEALGVELAWSVAVPQGGNWPPTTVLHVLRSTQELVSNALRHAHPTRVSFSLGGAPSRADWIRLAVEDNGPGGVTLDVGAPGRGHHNLRARAQRLGGEFSMEDLPQGSRAILEFPRPKATAA